jgi:hypothetical protein
MSSTELHHFYDSSKWATETMACYYEKRAKKFGIGKLLLGEVDLGNEELNNFVEQINSVLLIKNHKMSKDKELSRLLDEVEEEIEAIERAKKEETQK